MRKIKTNPRPRIGTKNPKRTSTVTGKFPTVRLISRRKRNSKKGFFPNPKRKMSPTEARRVFQSAEIGTDQTYKGYRIKFNAMKNLYSLSAGGAHLAWYPTISKAKREIDDFFNKNPKARKPTAKNMYDIESFHNGKWNFLSRYPSPSVAVEIARRLHKYHGLKIRVQKRVITIKT